jgi:hypothetical protein
MAYDLIQNLCSLTQIRYSVLNKLVQISENCICDYVLNAIDKDDDIIKINSGIGNIYINIMNDEIEYKFIPNKKLEKKLLKTIETNESPLVHELENKLNKKIIDTYKELL